MKRKISMLIVLALLATMLGGCQLFCKHEWLDATCELPQTCTKCGKTEGEALGHSWVEATCEEPETCSTCGMMRGEPKGHDYADATCDTPKTCTVCSATEGEALGHTWEEATTETPQTCSVCAATEGEPLDTDDRFTTAATKELQGKWTSSVPMTASELGLEGFDGVLECALYLEFSNVGDLTMSMGTKNEESFRADLTDYMIELLYAQFSANGIDAATANQEMITMYGMTTEEYAAATVEMISFDALFASFSMNMCYYVADGQVYIAPTWAAEFEGSNYTLDNGVLVIDNLTGIDGVTPTQWTRAEE